MKNRSSTIVASLLIASSLFFFGSSLAWGSYIVGRVCVFDDDCPPSPDPEGSTPLCTLLTSCWYCHNSGGSWGKCTTSGSLNDSCVPAGIVQCGVPRCTELYNWILDPPTEWSFDDCDHPCDQHGDCDTVTG